MIVPINIYSDEILRKKAKPLKGVDSTIEDLIASMFETMRNASGIGLAAPQVGHSIRLIVLDLSCLENHANEKPMVIINPHILAVRGVNEMEEGCLSVPGVQGDVERPAAITLKYRDEHFAEQSDMFSGMLARAIQHEIDHLDGTLFVDRMEKRDRKKIQQELDALTAGIVNTAYPIARETLAASQS
jgi:peptide deformylase